MSGERYRQLLESVCPFDETGAPVVQQSILVPQSRPSVVLALLSEQGDDARVDHQLQFQHTLGEGGMGRVRLAIQRALDRPVAVKSAREGRADETSRAALLREAWMTGSLEHPNIVPVYQIGTDASGQPLVVLKRIDGEAWSARLGRACPNDEVPAHLAILLEVMDAIRFAHSRGIIHRDLKPENVMIGEFGEVYVLDWGIAVSLGDDRGGRFATAQRDTGPVGTPGYMAPEMLRAGTIDERTDVYLLGATLFEVLTGRLPHPGPTLDDVVKSILGSPPLVPDSVPAELAAIISRAMAANPEDRYPSVADMQAAIRAHLEHRSSSALSDRANDRLDELRRRVKELRRDGDRAGIHDESLHGLFAECRFGFREALTAWPGNSDAQAGLVESVWLMVELELDYGEPRAARSLLAELDESSTDLAKRVEDAISARDDRIATLDRIGRDNDPSVGWRTRAFVLLLFGIPASVLPLAFELAGWDPRNFSFAHLSAISAAFLTTIASLFFWARESLMATAVNRRFVMSALLVGPAQLVMIVGYLLSGATPTQAIGGSVLIWFVVQSMLAITISPSLAYSAVGYLVAFLIISAFPGWAQIAIALSNAVMLWNVFRYTFSYKGDDPLRRPRPSRGADDVPTSDRRSA